MTLEELKDGVSKLTIRWCEQLPAFLAEMGPAYSERDIAKPYQDYYMRANTRIRWFNEYCSENNCLGRISSVLEAQPLANGCVLIQAKAEVYMDEELVASDVSGKLISCTPDIGHTLTRMDLESLSTFAKSRALANAGFTITGREPDDSTCTCDRGVAVYDSEVEEYKSSVDSGTVPSTNPVMDMIQASKQMFGSTPTVAQPSCQPAPTATPTPDRSEGSIAIIPNDCEVRRNERETRTSAQSQPIQNPPAMPAPSIPQTELDDTIEMTVDDARMVKVPGNGKFGGKTFGEIAVENGLGTLQWFATKYSGGDKRAKLAAQILANDMQQKLSAS